jgi:hypothetical protein
MSINLNGADVVLGTAATGIATAGAPEQFALTKVTLNNTGGAAVTVTLFRVPTGGAAGPSNVIYQGSVGANANVVANMSAHTLTNGQSLQGEASIAATVTCNASWTQTP